MGDEIIKDNQIYIQDVICDIVLQNPKEEDFKIYNKVVGYIDIEDFETAKTVLKLIKLNKLAFQDI